MKSIKIDASPKQLSRLRNGHRVRIKPAVEGSGFNLIIDPSKYDCITKSFSKGTAYQVQLTPDEIMANKQEAVEPTMEGQGIYAGGKFSFKKLGRTLKKGFQKTGSVLEDAGKKTIKGIRTAELKVRRNKTARAIVGKVLPILAKVGTQAALQYAGMDPKMAAELSKVSQIGASEGLKAGGYGLGAGLYAGVQGRALPGPNSRSIAQSAIYGGNLLNSQMNPALRSDPEGANLLMNTQLPPQFQRGGYRFA